ncbi:MAG: CvpA family protein [Odoribacteraceae bacterium]|jgi:membrane protein required for colicin V production|nr:CvpA family protein [Odoribacteraceae bacterium]
MNYLDIILLIPLLYGAARGISRGLVVEIATLLALVLGVYLALRCSDPARVILQEYMMIPPQYSYYVAFAIIFLVVVIVIHLLGKLLTKLLNVIALGLLNRLLGTLFGVLKMTIVVCALLFLFNSIDQQYGLLSAKTKEASWLYLPLTHFAEGVYHVVIHK